MKNSTGKRLLALFLCFVMCVSLLPVSAFADGTIAVSGEDGGSIALAAEEEPEQRGAITEQWMEADLETFVSTEAKNADIISGVCGKNLTWTLTEDGVLTISGTGPMDEYEYKNAPFTLAPWFDYQTSVTSVVIEDGVTSIGRYAFHGCSSMTSVTIPDSVVNIGLFAFGSCNSLMTAAIPASVASIGGGPFNNCTSLTDITVDSGNENYVAVDGVLFSRDMTLLVQYPAGKTEDGYDVPEGVTNIGENGLAYTNLERVSIPAGVTNIEDAAFLCSSSLNYVGLPDTVTAIGNEVFYRCLRLRDVTIPDNVTSIGRLAFFLCDSLTKITIPGNVQTIGSGAFRECSTLKEVSFIGDAPSIGNDAFLDVTATVFYPLGNSTWTDDIMLDYGGELTWVTEPNWSEPTYLWFNNNAKVQGRRNCLNHDKHYELVNVDTTYTEVEATCFEDGERVYTAVFDKEGYETQTKTVRLSATGHIWDTSVITKQPTMKEEGERVYTCTVCGETRTERILRLDRVRCGNNLSAEIDDGSVLTISGTGAMYDYSVEDPEPWEGLPISVVIEDGATSIGKYAFSGCETLVGVLIGKDVRSIGESAFADCPALMDVFYPGSEEEWQAIQIAANNTALTDATIHFNNSIGFCAYANDTDRDMDTVSVKPGQTATLHVEAASVYEYIGYQWYDSDGNAIAGATGPDYTTPAITGGTMFSCVAQTFHSLTWFVEFTVCVDSDLRAYVAGTTDTETIVPVWEGETAALSVDASVSYGEITYQWYKNGEPLDGATEAGYTTEEVADHHSNYTCVVSDEFGGTATVSFSVIAGSYISVEPKPVSGHGYWNEDESQYVCVPYGQSVTLGIIAESDFGGVQYQWYLNSFDDPIAGATETEFTVENVEEERLYYCRATDLMGTTGTIVCHVFVVDDGSDLELGKKAAAKIANVHDYAEFRFTPDTAGTYVFSAIGGAEAFGFLYDSDMNRLAMSVGGGEGGHFRIEHALAAGKTYILRAGYTGAYQTGVFCVSVMLDHVFAPVKTEAVEPTCEEAGNSEYWTCSECGRTFADAEGAREIEPGSWVIQPLGHTYEETEWTWAGDYSWATVTFTCETCGRTITESVLVEQQPADNIRTEVQNQDTENLAAAMEENNGATELIAGLEDQVQPGGTEVVFDGDVPASFDDAAAVGAALNTPEDGGQPISLVIAEANNDVEIPEEAPYEEPVVIAFSMTLVNVENTEQLAVPVKVTLPCPETIDPGTLIIYHYHGENTEPEEVAFTVTMEDGRTYISFVLTGFSNFAFVSEAPSCADLVSGEEATAMIGGEGELACFRFTPAETGEYLFRSTAVDGVDTCVCLYDAEWKELARSSDGGKDGNFAIFCQLEENRTYYFGVRFTDYSEGSFPVLLTPAPVITLFKADDRTIPVNENGCIQTERIWDDERQEEVEVQYFFYYHIAPSVITVKTEDWAFTGTPDDAAESFTDFYGCSPSYSTKPQTYTDRLEPGENTWEAEFFGSKAEYTITVVVPKTDALRIYGKTRYETCLAIAEKLRELKGGSFENIVVACGTNFPDALAGSYLAVVKNAPILLVDDSVAETISSYVAKNMDASGTIYILGSEVAVSAKVEIALRTTGREIKRLAGKDRYLTNIEILKEGGIPARSEILVCVGDNYADSLSASSSGLPIFLVGRTTLTAEQKEYLATLEDCTFTIIGSESAVNATIEEELRAYGSVGREAGPTRYQTSIAVAEHVFKDPDSVVLTVGNNFPDGLSAGPLANYLRAPVVLTLAGETAAAEAYAAGLTIRNGIAVGGSNVLSDDAVVSIFGLASAKEIEEYSRG